VSGLRPRALWLLALLNLFSALAIDWRRLNAHATEASAPTLATAAPSTAPPARTNVPAAAALRVLFVGNSLTSFNNLPQVVGELANAAGEPRPFAAFAELEGGTSLAGHMERGRVQARIAQEGPWHAVVLQEHGGFAAIEPAKMEHQTLPSVRTLQAMILAAGAQPVLFVPYARRGGYTAGDSYDEMQDRVNENHAAMARTLNIATVPVGEIWRTALRKRPTLQLWDERGMHPSFAGTYLAACAFYMHFYRKSPVGNAYTAGLALEDARAIQETVTSALAAD
jgi:hypothetical protein